MKILRMRRARGIEPVLLLCYGNPMYDSKTGPYSEEGREALGDYPTLIEIHLNY